MNIQIPKMLHTKTMVHYDGHGQLVPFVKRYKLVYTILMLIWLGIPYECIVSFRQRPVMETIINFHCRFHCLGSCDISYLIQLTMAIIGSKE